MQDSNLTYMDAPAFDEEMLMFQASQEQGNNHPAQFNGYDEKLFYDDYVMDEKGKYVNKVTKSKLTKSAFDNRFKNSVPTIEGKRPKPSTICEGMIPTIDRSEYAPDLPDVYEHNGVTILNLYARTHMEFIGDHSDALMRIKNHLNILLKNPKEEGLLLDWMAWNVQKTGSLKRFALLIVGTFGDGKSTISSIMGRALGVGNVGQISNGAISSSFTGWANCCAVGSIEELKMNGLAKYETYNNLKPYITNEEIEVTRKGSDPVTSKNVTNYIAYTNYRDAVPLEESDRRYWVMNTSALDDTDFDNKSPEYNKYFTDLYENLITNDVGQIRSALKSHVISEGFTHMISAPDSDAKRQMRFEAMTNGAHAMYERIEFYGDLVLENGWVNVTKIKQMEVCLNDFVNDDLPTGNGIKRAMIELGYKKQSRQTGGNRNVLYKK